MFASPAQSSVSSNLEKQPAENFEIFPFPYENRLCSIFPEISIPLTKDRIVTRLFFCLPEVKKPDITPRIDEKTMESVDVSWVETRPEAPWIKRNEQGVIFTDEVVMYDVEISESQSENEEEEGENQGEGEDGGEDEEEGEGVRSHLFDERNEQGMYYGYDGENSDEEGESSRKKVSPPNPRDFARMMRLDEETEAKLAKLLHN